jgi:transcriptional regulator with XRE-family HTH domain
MFMKNRNILLKNALDAAGISQEKLAVELGVSRAAVSERLNKDVKIDSIDFVLAVCKLTGHRFTDFVSLSEEEVTQANEPVQVYGWKAQLMKGLEMLEQEIKKRS